MTTQPVTILLAEDDDGHAQLVQRNLERAGLLNGFSASAMGRNFSIAWQPRGDSHQQTLDDALVVLLDINMPRIDGVEALRQIKANPATHRIPVIMLTTTDDPREIDRCYELGCNVYITKPVEYDGFIDAIRRLGLFLQIVQRPRNGNH